MTPDEVVVPIAARSILGDFDFDDIRPTFEPQRLEYRGELLPFQAKAVDALASQECGVLSAPCGAGKGEVIVALAARLGVPALVIVASLDQARELAERFERRLGIKVGMIGGGKRTIERVTVALIQSLNDECLARLHDRFDVVIVDEAHHVASPTYRRALNAITARRRYGFTATLEREDGLTPFVEHHLGPVRFSVSRRELADAGRSVVPTFRTLATGFEFTYRDADDYPALLDALVVDVARNRLIVDTVVREGGGCLAAVLTGRVAHAQALAELLRLRGVRVAVLTGETPKGERAKAIEDARAGALDVLVGTQLLDEGIDVPSLARLFLVFPARAEGRLVQRVGRALRVSPGKPAPVVFDFVDVRCGVLNWQARQRRKVFGQHWG